MNNRKKTRGRKRFTQIIEIFENVPCPIYGHPPNAVPNIGSCVSTHYKDTPNGEPKPYTVRRAVKRRHIIHRNQ